jgi:predicted CXXCH cytochrome family protein
MPDPLQSVPCPFCHTPHAALSDQALYTREYWVCVRCGQRWDAHRLETVAAYAEWVADRERV